MSWAQAIPLLVLVYAGITAVIAILFLLIVRTMYSSA